MTTLHFPNQEIKIVDKSYTLKGTFKTLAAMEQALGKDLLHIQAHFMELKFTDFVKVLAAALEVSEDTIGEPLLLDVGITSTDFVQLQMLVMCWLRVAMAPPAERTKKVEELNEILAQLRLPSPGQTTNSLP